MESFLALLGTIVASDQFAAFLFSALVAIATWIAKSVVAILKNKLTDAQLAILFKVASQAVLVAEQTGALKTSEEKKAEAIRVAQTYLEAYKIKVSLAQLDAAIEAAVYSELTQFKPPLPSAEPVEPGTPTAPPSEFPVVVSIPTG